MFPEGFGIFSYWASECLDTVTSTVGNVVERAVEVYTWCEDRVIELAETVAHTTGALSHGTGIVNESAIAGEEFAELGATVPRMLNNVVTFFDALGKGTLALLGTILPNAVMESIHRASDRVNEEDNEADQEDFAAGFGIATLLLILVSAVLLQQAASNIINSRFFNKELVNSEFQKAIIKSIQRQKEERSNFFTYKNLIFAGVICTACTAFSLPAVAVVALSSLPFMKAMLRNSYDGLIWLWNKCFSKKINMSEDVFLNNMFKLAGQEQDLRMGELDIQSRKQIVAAQAKLLEAQLQTRQQQNELLIQQMKTAFEAKSEFNEDFLKLLLEQATDEPATMLERLSLFRKFNQTEGDTGFAHTNTGDLEFGMGEDELFSRGDSGCSLPERSLGH